MELCHPIYNRITINPEVCFGKPCIRGMRFPVATILAYLAGGMSIEVLLEEFPFLQKEDILDSMAFAATAVDDIFIPLERRA